MTRPADLVEEVARLHGYDRFEATLPTGPGGGLTPEQKRARRLTSALVGLGMHQTVTLPFVTQADLAKLGWTDTDRLLTVANPLRDEEATMRPTMLPGMLNVARYNFSYGMSEVALFEMARVFRAELWSDDPRLPEQKSILAWVIVGGFGPRLLGEEPPMADAMVSISSFATSWQSPHTSSSRSSRLKRPAITRAAQLLVRLGGSVIGHVGELSPEPAGSSTSRAGLPSARSSLIPCWLGSIRWSPPRRRPSPTSTSTFRSSCRRISPWAG